MRSVREDRPSSVRLLHLIAQRILTLLVVASRVPSGGWLRHEVVGLVTYLRLTKPRSVSLLLVTALAGMAMAGPGLPPLSLLALTLLGGALAAGGANALNCYLDRDLDRQMARTAVRPLPSGRLAPRRALLFGLVLSAASVAVFGIGVNPLSAVLAALGVLYYVVVYTWWLKRSSPWNVVIGGGAGALPLLVGWASATGQVSAWAVWLGTVVLCWTPPHFWSLALVRHREYALAGIPVLPVVRGLGETRSQILGYSIALLLLTMMLVPAGFVGILFLVSALVLGGTLVFLAVRLLHQATERAAWQLYRYSVVYLALIFGSMILDRLAQS